MSEEETITINRYCSERVQLGRLIISAAHVTMRDVDLVVGRPGFPNVARTLRTGGAILFETPDEGVIEVRVMRIRGYTDCVEVLVRRVSSRAGISAGFVEQEAGNAPFEPHERARIGQGLKLVREAVAQRKDITGQQSEYVCRKLDELQQASERFGRRDWINLVVGTLTNTIVSAALGSDFGRFLFQAVGNALSWLFTGPARFLP